MNSYCGYIALIGRPNVGKSTLMNCILGEKLSITSRKPQTTRHRILGILSEEDYQYIFIDTPGIHQSKLKKINSMMNRSAISTLKEVELIVFIVEGTRWTEEDEQVLQLIKRSRRPCVLVINKIDKIKDKATLLPLIEAYNQRHNFDSIIPVSAKTGLQVDKLKAIIKPYMPEGPHLYDADQFTDRPVKFLCAELLREKIFRYCGQELPYSASVEIESFVEEGNLIRIHALIIVEKENHKRMIIGDEGAKLKEMATAARVDMEKMLGSKVFLKCWCKVKPGWADNKHVLKQLGYDS